MTKTVWKAGDACCWIECEWPDNTSTPYAPYELLPWNPSRGLRIKHGLYVASNTNVPGVVIVRQGRIEYLRTATTLFKTYEEAAKAAYAFLQDLARACMRHEARIMDPITGKGTIR